MSESRLTAERLVELRDESRGYLIDLIIDLARHPSGQVIGRPDIATMQGMTDAEIRAEVRRIAMESKKDRDRFREALRRTEETRSMELGGASGLAAECSRLTTENAALQAEVERTRADLAKLLEDHTELESRLWSETGALAAAEAERDAERERCAKIADRCAAERANQIQFDPGIAEFRRDWLLCKQSEAERIAASIRGT